jgi:hypothetical protein
MLIFSIEVWVTCFPYCTIVLCILFSSTLFIETCNAYFLSDTLTCLSPQGVLFKDTG